MTAKEAASRSPEGCASRYQDGVRWVWKADVDFGVRPVRYDRNGYATLFARLKQEEIDAVDDWEPMLETHVRKSFHRHPR